jgi:hypothetical protein
VCSVLDSMISVTYFNHAENGIHTLKAVEFLGELTIGAGACMSQPAFGTLQAQIAGFVSWMDLSWTVLLASHWGWYLLSGQVESPFVLLRS